MRPVVDEFAFEIFALGLIGTGSLAVPVLAGSVSYALGSVLVAYWPCSQTGEGDDRLRDGCRGNSGRFADFLFTT